MKTADTPKAHVLVVDDEESIRLTLRAFLKAENYTVETRPDAPSALAFLAENDVDVIVSDIVMPGLSGVALLQEIRVASPHVQVIMMTGEPTVDTATEAVRAGACDYLAKPVDKKEILRAVSTASLVKHLDDETRRLTLENAEYRQSLEQQVKERTEELQASLSDARFLTESTIMAMGKVVEIRDPYTAGHQERVAELARAIAIEMELDTHTVEGIWHASLVHDLGKIGVPSEILNSPGRLSDEAMALVKQHSEMGARILHGINFPWPIERIILEHHERLDGSGYPYGLSDNDISIEGRIVGIADVVESMSSHRPYRPSLGIDAALTEIRQYAPEKFDIEVVQACSRLFREKGFQLTVPNWGKA